jgi:hypothetical protein
MTYIYIYIFLDLRYILPLTLRYFPQHSVLKLTSSVPVLYRPATPQTTFIYRHELPQAYITYLFSSLNFHQWGQLKAFIKVTFNIFTQMKCWSLMSH